MSSNFLRKVSVVFIGFVVVFFLYSALAKHPQQSAHPPRLYSGVITIGTETWPGYLCLYIARDLGFFKDAGLDVEIKRYVALGELSKDYVAGKMQGRANLTLDMVNERLQGLDHQAVLVIDYSSGSDAIVAAENTPTLNDIRGKRVAFESGTLEEFFIVWALKQVGLTLADIVPVKANPEESAKRLAAGELDVAVSHEPFLSKILGEGPYHRIYSSADAPGLITDVLTFRSDFIRQYPDAVEAVIKAYFRALAYSRDHPEEAHQILAKEFSDTPAGIADQLKGIKILDEKDNETAFTFAGGLHSLYGNLRQIGGFVLGHSNSSDRDLDTDLLIDPHFIRRMNRENNK